MLSELSSSVNMRQIAVLIVTDTVVCITRALNGMPFSALNALFAIAKGCKGFAHLRVHANTDVGIATIGFVAIATNEVHTGRHTRVGRFVGEVTVLTSGTEPVLQEVAAYGNLSWIVEVVAQRASATLSYTQHNTSVPILGGEKAIVIRTLGCNFTSNSKFFTWLCWNNSWRFRSALN